MLGTPAAATAQTDSVSPAAVVPLKVKLRAQEQPESIELLDGGAQAYPRMLAAIENAKRSVHLEVYRFSAEGIGIVFIDALSAAARRGVDVEVVIDAWGSVGDARQVSSQLRAAGCSARVHNRLITLLIGRFGRNHRKLLLVDSEVAVIGGINIGDENLPHEQRKGWADLALEIRGPQCRRLTQRILRAPVEPADSSLEVLMSRLGGGWRMRRRYIGAFKAARERILVAHGYFLPDAGVVRAIVAAARRGVSVELVLAGRSDVPFTLAATRSLHRRLLKAGVRIYEWSETVLHAKVAAVDGERLLIGSFNLDRLSLANLEVLVQVDDARVAQDGETWIRKHIACSTAVLPSGPPTRMQRWVAEPLGRLVARIADLVSRVIASRRERKATRTLPPG